MDIESEIDVIDSRSQCPAWLVVMVFNVWLFGSPDGASGTYSVFFGSLSRPRTMEGEDFVIGVRMVQRTYSRASTVDGSLVHVRFACFTSLRVAIRDISSVVAAMEMLVGPHSMD